LTGARPKPFDMIRIFDNLHIHHELKACKTKSHAGARHHGITLESKKPSKQVTVGLTIVEQPPHGGAAPGRGVIFEGKRMTTPKRRGRKGPVDAIAELLSQDLDRVINALPKDLQEPEKSKEENTETGGKEETPPKPDC
jgi:hypothetical protein